MKNRAFHLLIALALILCVFCASALSVRAEEPTEVRIDISDHALQFGGLLPSVPANQRVPRGDQYEAVKKVIKDALSAWQATINIVSYRVPQSEIASIYFTVLNENPELFHVDGHVSWSYSGSYATSITPEYNTSYTQADVTAYKNTVQYIVGMLDPGWSEVEKLLFLHDYLVTHCEYDLSYARHNAHDALVVGSAVCQGYALAFNDLCRKSGISSTYVSSQVLNHSWNLVAVGGERCYIDCTWDDPSNYYYEGYCCHENFMLSRSALAATSTEHEGTDWTDGMVNVYETVETTSRYDGAWWQDVCTAVPLIGHIGAYTLENDPYNIYLRNMSNNNVASYSLPETARWYAWGSNSIFYTTNFCSVAASDGVFYFTLPTSIWSLSTGGQISCAYQMTAEEKEQGYIYGIVGDGGTLYYNIGKKSSNTTFVRSVFQGGPVIGEIDGFTYQVREDGTAGITGCSLLGEIVIPAELDGYTVSNLAAKLFFDTSGITAVTIPATVTSFGEDPSDNMWDYVFSYCYDLTRIDVAADNPAFCSVDGVLYSKDQSILINYPCSRGGEVYRVDAADLCCTSFASCRNLKYLFLDSADTWWYTYAFYNDVNLTVFYIPGGYAEQKVGIDWQEGRAQGNEEEYAYPVFRAATGEIDGFTYWVLEDGTAGITGCSLQGEIVIPAELDGFTVSNLASHLFFAVSDVTSVTIPATVTSFGENPWDNMWDYVFSYCYDLTRIDVAADNPSFCSVDGVLYSKDQSLLINYPCSRSGEVYHVGAADLCCTSFASCRNLKFLFLDSADTWWYTYAFYNDVGLTVFYISGGYAEQKAGIDWQEGRAQGNEEEYAYPVLASTEALRYLPAQLLEIEEDAFQGTDILYLVAPQGCERIRKGAFVDSGLVYLSVGPNTVIENGALPDYTVVERR